MTNTARPTRYFQSSGKFHAAYLGTESARCGATAALDLTTEIAVDGNVDTATVHPIVCRRCLRLAASAGRARTTR